MTEQQPKALQPNTFKCAECGGIFEKGRTDEEAAADIAQEFTGFTVADCDVVCDDCYQEFMKWFDTVNSNLRKAFQIPTNPIKESEVDGVGKPNSAE